MGRGSGCQIATVTGARVNCHSAGSVCSKKQINSKRGVRAGQLLPRQGISGPSRGALLPQTPLHRAARESCSDVHRHSIYLTKRRKSDCTQGGLFLPETCLHEGGKGLFSLFSTNAVYISGVENPPKDKVLRDNICIQTGTSVWRNVANYLTTDPNKHKRFIVIPVIKV